MNPSLILASNSPRRKELLRQVGAVFTAVPADVDESVLPDETPERYAMRVALDKARMAAPKTGSGTIIAADTIVTLDDAILGKPRDERDAGDMLTTLSGKMHRVITGLAVMDAASGRSETRSAVTRVWFRDLSSKQIASYVATGEPLDKAGAYGIQGKGALLVTKIEGCYFNVVGLPLFLLNEMLQDFGLDLL